MNVVSVNVGLPREVHWRGRRVRSAIWKAPVSGRVHVAPHQVEGDRQADLRVHGGPSKAVYAYPSEHYAYWRRLLPDMPLPWGAFGENLTTEGLLEDALHVGDRLRIGSVEFAVTKPRMPCFKLAVRFERDDMVRLFAESGTSGFYLAVLAEGDLEGGDAIEFTGRNEAGITIAETYRRSLSEP